MVNQPPRRTGTHVGKPHRHRHRACGSARGRSSKACRCARAHKFVYTARIQTGTQAYGTHTRLIVPIIIVVRGIALLCISSQTRAVCLPSGTTIFFSAAPWPRGPTGRSECDWFDWLQGGGVVRGSWVPSLMSRCYTCGPPPPPAAARRTSVVSPTIYVHGLPSNISEGVLAWGCLMGCGWVVLSAAHSTHTPRASMGARAVTTSHS